MITWKEWIKTHSWEWIYAHPVYEYHYFLGQWIATKVKA